MSSKYDARIAKGIQWLDKTLTRPVWYARYSKYKLDMNDCSQCMLGVTIGNYWHVVNRGFNLDSNYPTAPEIKRVHKLSKDWAIAHGFDLPDGANDPDYNALTQAWKDCLADLDD